MKIVVSILTFERAPALRLLLQDLEREKARFDAEIAIRIIDDASSGYGVIRTLAQEHGYEYVRAERHYGRDEHWRLVHQEISTLRREQADYYVFVPDDVRLRPHFFARALRVWERLGDATALSLAVLRERERGSWTSMNPRQADGAIEVGWIDGLYLCRRELLELLDYRVRKITRRGWGESIGSGVGAQLSRRLVARRARLYRVDRSLVVFPEPKASHMNPIARLSRPAVALRPVADVEEHTRVTRVADGSRSVRISIGSRCHIGKAMRQGSYYEIPLLRALRHLAGAGGTWVDVGAHVGNHTAYFSVEAKAQHVVAIEPSLSSWINLTETIERSRLRNVRAIRAAVHDRWRSASVVEASAKNTGMTRVVEGGPCPVVRLDDVLAGEDVRVLKIDVEGHSASVLRSGVEMLARCQPILGFEAATQDEFDEAHAVLRPLGYEAPAGCYGWTPFYVFAAPTQARARIRERVAA